MFLRHSQNKQELFRYLSDESVSSLKDVQSDFYITAEDIVRHVGPGNNMVGKCNHEEADTRIVLHVLHSLQEGARTILVRTVDSDVVVILVYHFNSFLDIAEDCQLLIHFGLGNNKRIIDVEKITTALGPRRSRALPLWYALTGCDSTSSIRGKSKTMAFKAWKRSPESLTETMVNMMDNPFTWLDIDTPEFKYIEQYFMNLYGSQEEDTINNLRKTIFCHKTQNPEKLPPTQNALLHHCKRSIYQASIWASANMTEMTLPDPCKFGWKKEANRLLPIWINVPIAANICQEITKCGCKKKCSNSCSCTRKVLNCTALCKCSCKIK